MKKLAIAWVLFQVWHTCTWDSAISFSTWSFAVHSGVSVIAALTVPGYLLYRCSPVAGRRFMAIGVFMGVYPLVARALGF